MHAGYFLHTDLRLHVYLEYDWLVIKFWLACTNVAIFYPYGMLSFVTCARVNRACLYLVVFLCATQE